MKIPRIRKIAARVPVPPVDIVLTRRRLPSSRYDLETGRRVLLIEPDWDDPGSLAHELGHAFDDHYLTDEDRLALTKIFGGPPRPWWWPPGSDPMNPKGPDPYCEDFANAYAEAATSRLRGRKFRKFLRGVTRR